MGRWEDRFRGNLLRRTNMKAATGVKVAFGILALYMSIPLTILAAQRMAAGQTNLPPMGHQAATASAVVVR
jgi:hypothetical protein